MDLPKGCHWVGSMPATAGLAACLERWQQPGLNVDLLLLLAATQTAEQDGISAAGATAASRRLTALADAELLLRGTEASRRWALPPLPAGVSPALLSRVAVESLHLKPQVVALGLHHSPDFPHLRLESVSQGPSACLSGGQAMSPDRVETLWNQGERLGRRLRRPLVLAECVPGGTTTALAVLTALGLQAGDLVSGSARQPPQALKQQLVATGLQRAQLPHDPSARAVLAAVGDPFQAVAAGLLCGAAEADQPVLLGGGSQMVAVLTLALSSLPVLLRQRLSQRVLIGTTAWLAQESVVPPAGSMLSRLVALASDRCAVPLAAMACGVRFSRSRHQQLQDFERGYVKEGVGAGALLLLAQLQGIPADQLEQRCDQAMDRLLNAPVGSGA
nr:nicotinate-nucleotide--dimethylbenzimidazole phosphoribosyltransferase [Synechococcus sp. CC9616]